MTRKTDKDRAERMTRTATGHKGAKMKHNKRRSEVVSLDSLQRIADFICAKNGYWAEIGVKEYTDAMLVFGAISSGTCYTLMNDLGVSYQPTKAYSTPKYCTVDIGDPELAAANLIRIVDADPPCWCEDGAYQHLIA